MSKVTIGLRMKGLRLNSGKSMSWLGKNVFDRTKVAISSMERQDSIGCEMLMKACEFYGVSADWILFGKEYSGDKDMAQELSELRAKVTAIQKIVE